MMEVVREVLGTELVVGRLVVGSKVEVNSGDTLLWGSKSGRSNL